MTHQNFKNRSHQQMPSNMQQQPGSQQQPAAQIQPGQVPAQFSGYVNSNEQQHTGNATPFIYSTNQRMGIPHQGQQPNQVPPGAPQASSHHPFTNPQYMFHPQYATGQMNYYDQTMAAQQFIQSQGGAYTTQYIYAQNPSTVNMYSQTSNNSFFFYKKI